MTPLRAMLVASAIVSAHAFVALHPAPARQQMHSMFRMRVDAVESTPNPSSFLLRLDAPLDGLTSLTGLRGETFRKAQASSESCPTSLKRVLNILGVDSVFAMPEKLLTVNKVPEASWEAVLPQVIEALGGGTERLVVSGLPLSVVEVNAPVGMVRGVRIRLQVCHKLPIQVEATGWLGTPPVRAKLSPRFGSAMGLLIGEVGGPSDAFFKGRTWLDRGMRYPEEALLTKDPSALLNADDPVASEQEAVRRALEIEVAEVESAFSDGRLAAIVYGSRVAAPPCSNVSEVEGLLSLEEVDRLCDEDMALEARGERGLTQPLERLARFVATGEGVLGARRNAVAYIGGTGGRGGADVFEAVASTFQTAKAAGLRRTAGDALSDLGDPRAVPLATVALADSAALVRWRAARILGELGEADGGSTVAALNQAALQERAFEVSFELKDAARKVQLRAEGDGGARGPTWKQMMQGPRA